MVAPEGNTGLAVLCFQDVVTKAAQVFADLGADVLKVDPALASSVFVTTATDVLGFLFLLGLGAYFLGRYV